MKRFLTLLTCIVFATVTALADGPFREHRYDGFKVATINENSIVFIGNSITNMHDWHSAFANHNVVNRGVSGGYATEILANLESYIAGKPAKVFLMIGTNDMAPNGLSHTPEQIAGNIRKIVERIENESPNTKVYLTSIFPSTSTGRSLEKIQAANALIKELAEEKNLVYVDLYNDLQGILDNTHSRDGLHLSMSGYRIWCNKIKEYVGSDCVYPANATNQYVNGLAPAYNMRVSCWGGTPIVADDVLMIGDEMISSGEWHEMLNCGNVKNYGQAWGYPGAWMEHTLNMLPVLFDGRTDNVDPKQVFLYTGVADVNDGNTTLETAQTRYQNILNKIKQLAPTTKVYLMSLQPTANANTNTDKVKPFNAWLQTVAAGDESVEYVDIYTAFENGNGVGDSKYFQGNYLWGLGYAKVASILAPLIEGASAMTEAEAEAQINLLNARNTLGLAISNLSDLPFGDGVGQYPSEYKAAVDAGIAQAYALLNKDGVTVEELQAGGQQLTEAVNSIKSTLNQPKVSVEGDEHWYKITTPLRGNRIITSTGAAAGIMGNEMHNYPTGWWKFTQRTDGSYNIVNRHDGSFISPSAAQNSQLQTSTTEPSAGWTLSAGDEYGLYIVKSGSAQFNQTQASLGWKLYNWGGGGNTSDTGCQLRILEAEGEPTPMPEAGKALLTLTNITLDGSAPYKIDDELAQPVLDAGSVTVAIDYTLSNGANAEQCLFGSSDSNETADFSCLTVNAGAGKFIARFDSGGGRFTMNGVSGTNRTKVVLTMSTSGYNLYVNNNSPISISHASSRDLGCYDGVNGLYLGGLVTSNNSNFYPMTGTVHSVQFFPGVLTAAEIAQIEYDNLIPTGINAPAVEGAASDVIYDLSGRRVQKAGKGVYIINGKVVVR